MNLKRFYKFLIASIAISITINLINAYFRGKFLNFEGELEGFLVNFMFTIVLSSGNQWWFDFLGKKLSWRDESTKRLIYGAIGSVVLTMLLLSFLNFFTYVVIYDTTIQEFLDDQETEWYVFGLIITLFVSAIYHAIYFYKASQAQKVNEQKTIARSATAQFDALKNQLDPHFLFNSLNVLVSLIEENPKAATKFTTSLSKVYRYVLEQRNKELVSVDEELKFARTYVGLLKTRFEDSIEIEIPEQGSIENAKVVPLSLQLLIENAVKHNIVSSNKPLKLNIYEQDQFLVIENNLQKKQVIKESSGVGLQNIESRYRLLTKRQMTINETTDTFKVSVPILTNQSESVNLNTIDMENTEDIRLTKAKLRVDSIKDFYDNAVKTLVILAFLAAINAFTGGFPWVIFPAIGMGISLLFKYMRTFNKNFFLGESWKERKINELMNNERF
ncbi:2TM domain-containing protein [Nonlabens dokdonensis]|uniref:2TM domain-containing protein n=2 Tax=Nonlabens dokdonensis TaxID=328515 RepID=A0ABX5PVI1_9FLAO|nr:histidine kinase [Nonlabens dokdonensis]AGC78457.1 putative two-component sensor histidine kinase transcriptional regulator [Nonlabens dokdonensis DSW-6]PZX38202.1 2TM domain-containing protein [Nonlabens dokdonensis]